MNPTTAVDLAIIEDWSGAVVPDPFAWVRLIIYILLPLALLTGILVLLYRKKMLPGLFKVPDPAHVLALQQLSSLEVRMDDVEGRDFIFEVSGTLRHYLQGRFGLRAPHRSSEEFLAEAREHPELRPEERGSLEEFLMECDAVKFANAQTLPERKRILLEATVRFVEATKALPEPIEPKIPAHG